MSTIHKIIPVSITLLPPPPLTQLKEEQRAENVYHGVLSCYFCPSFSFHDENHHKRIQQQLDLKRRKNALKHTPLDNKYILLPYLKPFAPCTYQMCCIYVAVCFALPGLVSTTCYSSQIFQVNDPVVLPYPLGITEGLFRCSLIIITSKEIKISLKKHIFERNFMERNFFERNIFSRNLF